MSLYAEPWSVTDLSQCSFYHAMDLPGIGYVRGNWDLRLFFERYTGGVEFAGKSTLDVGTASGFLTFEAERRGADVVSFDSAMRAQHHGVPYLDVRRNEGSPPAENLDFEAGRSAYWLAHRALGSKARCFYGDVYNLPEALGEFDVVLVCNILVHLRDPIGALTSIAARCRDKLVITEGMTVSELPVAVFLGYHETPERYPNNTWWQYTTTLYRQILKILGFEILRFEENSYPWQNPAGLKHVYKLGTIVAQRVAPAR
jgi:SAM-dependent methyltransferase